MREEPVCVLAAPAPALPSRSGIGSPPALHLYHATASCGRTGTRMRAGKITLRGMHAAHEPWLPQAQCVRAWPLASAFTHRLGNAYWQLHAAVHHGSGLQPWCCHGLKRRLRTRAWSESELVPVRRRQPRCRGCCMRAAARSPHPSKHAVSAREVARCRCCRG